MILKRKTIIQGILEDNIGGGYSYGASNTPNESIPNIFLNVFDPVISPRAGEIKNIAVTRPWFGGSKKKQVTEYVDLSFKVPIVIPDFIPTTNNVTRDLVESEVIKLECLLGCCGLIKKENGNDWFFEETSTNLKYGTFDYYIDGMKHRIKGTRGSVKIIFNAGDFPYYDFTMKGLYKTPELDFFPLETVNFYNTASPLPVNNSNTSITLTPFNGTENSIYCSVCEIDIGNQVEYRPLIGGANITIVDRVISGKLVWEANVNNSYFNSVENEVHYELKITHKLKNSTYQKLLFLFPNIVLNNYKYEENNGVYFYSADFFLDKFVSTNNIQIWVYTITTP